MGRWLTKMRVSNSKGLCWLSSNPTICLYSDLPMSAWTAKFVVLGLMQYWL